MNDILELAAVALVTLIAVPANVFVVGYWLRRSPTTGKRAWRSSIFGKGLLIAEGSFAALVDVSLLFWIFDAVPGADAVQLVVFAGLLVGQLMLCRALWQTRPDEHRGRARDLARRLLATLHPSRH